MADNDDINSKSGPVNGAKSVGPIEDVLQSEFVSRIEQIGREFGRTTGRQQRLERLIQKSYEDQPKAERALINQRFASYADEQAALAQLGQQFDAKRRQREEELLQAASGRMSKAQDLARNALMSEIDPSRIRTQARELSLTDPSIQAEAARMAQTLSSSQISRQRTDIQNKLGALEIQGQNVISGGLFGASAETGTDFEVTQAGSKSIQGISASVSGIVRQEAIIAAAQRIQRIQGKDYQSRMDVLAKGVMNAQEDLSVNDMTRQLMEKGTVTIADPNDPKSTRDVSAGDIKSERLRQEQELIRIHEKLSNAAEESADKLLEHSDTIQDNISKLKEAERLSDSGMSKGQMTAGRAMMVSSGFSALAGGIDQIFVGQRMQKMANRAGLADIENEKYNMYRAALSGDMTAMMALGQFGASEEFGKSLANAKGIALGAQIAASGAEGVAGGYLLAQGGAQQINPAAQALGTASVGAGNAIQGANMLMSSITNTAVTASDLAQGISYTSTKIAAENLDMETRKKIAAIPGFQMQQLYNFGMGMGTAAIGMGRGAEAFLQSTTGTNIPNAPMLDRMRALNISPEQMTEMVNFGVTNIGNTFTPEMALTARGLERSGRGTREENLQRMAMLAQAGANNPQAGLQSVLEAAVGRGFDNSKSMTLLVQNTSEMARERASSVAAGLDVTGAISTVLAEASKGSANEAFGLERARTVQESIAGVTTNVSTDLAGLLNTSRISAKTGLGGQSAYYAAQLTPIEIKALMGKSEAEAKEFLIQKGIAPGEIKGGMGQFLSGLYESSLQSLVVGQNLSGAANMSESERNKALEALRTGDYSKLSDDERAKMSRLIQNVGEQELRKGVGALTAENAAGAKEDVNKQMAGLSAGPLLSEFDKVRTAGFGQLTDAAKEATKQFGTAAETMKALADQVQRLRTSDVEKIMSDAAAKSAGGGEGSKVFQDSVKIFEAAVNKLAIKAGIDTTSMKTEERQASRAANNLIDAATSKR